MICNPIIKKNLSLKMNYIEHKDNLVDFPEKFLNLRDELNFKHEALLEDKEVERRVGIYDGLVEKGGKFDANGVYAFYGSELYLEVSGTEFRRVF